MKKRLIYILFYILIMFVYFNFIYDLKCKDLSDSFVVFYNILFYYIVSFPIIMVFLYYKKFCWPYIFMCMSLHIVICLIVIKKINSNIINDRPSMIIPTKIIKKTTSKIWLKKIGRYKDTSIIKYSNLGEVGSKVYMQFSLDCSRGDTLLSTTKPDSIRIQIHGFGFYEGKDFYNYHDYSLKNPDLVYYKVGFNVLYKAYCDTSIITGGRWLLSFTDILGKKQTVKYFIIGYPTIPDTLLVYHNINENLDTKWHICDPEINTPENRAKISDYGYIFHNDVYSKQEIESQCPRIKEYVEQYKNRMSPPL